MGQENRAGGLTFPIKLRCSAASDLCTEPGLEDALTRALGRAFARARSSLPAASAFGGGVVLGAPELTTGGLAPGDSAALLARVGRAIAAPAREQKLPLVTRSRANVRGPAAAKETRKPDPREVTAPFDRERFDPETSTYLLPSYDGGRQLVAVAGASPKFDVQETDTGLFINGILVFQLQKPDAGGPAGNPDVALRRQRGTQQPLDRDRARFRTSRSCSSPTRFRSWLVPDWR